MSNVNFNPTDRAYRLPHRVRIDGKLVERMQGDGGRVRLMSRSGGYVMVRRPRAMPFVLTEKEWARMPLWPLPEDGSQAPPTTNPSAT